LQLYNKINSPLQTRWKIAQFFELLWWKNYLSKKNIQQYLLWKQNYWHQFLSHLPDAFQKKINNTTSLQILDAGCGPAGIFSILNQHQLTAIDPLITKYQSEGLLKPENFEQVQFQSLKIESLGEKEKYDIIFCLNAINHVENLNQSITNLCCSLKPGGFIVTSVDVHKNHFLQKIFSIIPGDILHPHQLSAKDYQELFQLNGIKNMDTKKIKKGKVFNYVLISGIKSNDVLPN